MEYQQLDYDKYAKAAAHETEIDGLKCIVINRMLSNSFLFESVKQPEHDMLITFGWRKKCWNVSVYSNREDVDVSVFAKKHGGGGHKGAAGFEADDISFLLG